MIALLSHSRNGQGRSAWQVSVSVTRHLWLAVAVVDYGFRLQLPPPPFTPARSSSAARLREGAARSPFVLRSAQPRLRVAARDRSDTAARRRVRLPWQAFDGARQGICAGQRAVRRPWDCASAPIPRIYPNLLIPHQLAGALNRRPGAKSAGRRCRGRPASAARCPPVNPLLTMPGLACGYCPLPLADYRPVRSRRTADVR